MNDSDVCVSNEKPESVTNDDNDKHYISDYQSYRDFVSLQYQNVSTDEHSDAKESNDDGPVVCISALQDSRSQVCIVKSSLFESGVLPKQEAQLTQTDRASALSVEILQNAAHMTAFEKPSNP